MHNHADRGALHSDCRECEVLAVMLDDAGLSRGWRTLSGDVLVSGFDDRPDLNIAGEEMTNQPSVISAAGDTAEHSWLSGLLARMSRLELPYGVASQLSHAYLDHAHFMVPLNLSLAQAQEVHAGLHHMNIGHTDSPDHFVPPVAFEQLRSRRRLLGQRLESIAHAEQRSVAATRRSEAARAQRAQALVDSARALIRATDHVKGTVLPRATFTGATATVEVKVGSRDRVTVATATCGQTTSVGTAVCHPTDRFDAEVGTQLAVARALVGLGAVVEAVWMDHTKEKSS